MLNKTIIPILFLSILSIISCKDDNNGDGNGNQEIPKITISSVTLFEGNENSFYSFRVSNSTASTSDMSFDYATEEITAGDGLDYFGTSGTLTIPAGEREVFIEVEIIADIFLEQDEQFRVRISNPVNATIINNEGIGTIRNDDTFVDIPEDGYITPESYVGYDLAWSDEFTDPTINTSNWTHEIGNNGWGNNELQYYTDSNENSYISNGSLILEAKEQSLNGAEYTSARMITAGKQEFAFGRVDIRAILPEGQGIWPALWMLGSNIWDIGWPACGEIDIMELVGHEPSTTHGTAHWGPQGQSYSNYTGGDYNLSGGEKFSEKFHVFSIIWEPNSIKYLVDDTEFFTIDNTQVNGNYPFNQEFFFIFNIAVGGNWPGNPDASTQFPQRMYVDYIRIFQES